MTQSYTTSREDHIIIMTTEEDTTTMKTRAGSYNTATTTPTTNNDDAESYYSDYVIAVDIDKDFLLDIETGIPTSTEPHTCTAITPTMRNSSLSATTTTTTVPSVIDISIATTIPTSNNDDTTTAASKAMNMKTNPMPCSSCPDEDDDEVYDRDNLDNKHQPCSSVGDTDNVVCCCCCTGRCCTVLLFIYDLYARNKFIVATILSIVLLITIIGLGEYLTST